MQLPMTRRRWLGAHAGAGATWWASGAAALAAGALAGCGGPGHRQATPEPAPSPDDALGPGEASTYRIPGEFEPQRVVWLGFDRGLEDVSVALARALIPHVQLRVLVNDTAEADAARRTLLADGLPADRLGFLIEPLAMYYLRDATAFATGPAAGLAVVDFQWTHYGMAGWCRWRHTDSAARAIACVQAVDTTRDALAGRIATLAAAQRIPSQLALEGGGLESNGQGLVIACEALMRQRNPDQDRDALDARYRELPGVRRVIWLPAGLAEDPHQRATIVGPYVGWGTGGHTDEFVRFADARTVLLAWPDDRDAASHPVSRLTRQRMQRNAEILAASRTLDGQPLRVLRVPMPRPNERRVVLRLEGDSGSAQHWSPDHFPTAERRREGDVLTQVAASSYLNFVITNGAVILPDYLPHGTPRALQERVLRVFEQAFPQRRIVFVDALALNWLGGGLHCASLHEPLPAT